VVLVTLVQGVISTFHEYLCPLNERGSQEAGKRANDDLLEKRAVHGTFNSSEGARIRNVSGSWEQGAIFGMGVAGLEAMADPIRSQSAANDAEQLSRLLELELIQKRAAWKQAQQRKKSYRSLAFLFLFLLFAACLLGFFFAFNRVSEERQNRPAATSGH
jgi:hypothetical protein